MFIKYHVGACIRDMDDLEAYTPDDCNDHAVDCVGTIDEVTGNLNLTEYEVHDIYNR